MNNTTKVTKESMQKSLKVISGDRDRTNILKKWEQQAIAFLVQIIPGWVTSDMLTFTGFLGSVLVFVSFVLARFLAPEYMLLGVLGFAISWFGDSLDGRLAYYRHLERKNYGFALDMTITLIMEHQALEYGLVLQLDLGYRLDSFHVHLTYQKLQQPQ